MKHIVFIISTLTTVRLGNHCVKPMSFESQSRLTEMDDRTFPAQEICQNRNALLLWKANPVSWNSLATKSYHGLVGDKSYKNAPAISGRLALGQEYLLRLQEGDNNELYGNSVNYNETFSLTAFVDGCKMIRYVVTNHTYDSFTTQTFAAWYKNNSLQNIAVQDRTFKLMDEHYQIYSVRIDKMVYANPDGTLETEQNIPTSLHTLHGKPILVARVAQNNDKWAIFQLCHHDVAWVVVSTEKARENPIEYLQHYEEEIETALRALNIDTTAMVDIDNIILPFEPAYQLPPYRIPSASKSIAEAPKKTKGSRSPGCLFFVNRLKKKYGFVACRKLISNTIPPRERKKVVRNSVDQTMDRVHLKNAASPARPSSPSPSRASMSRKSLSMIADSPRSSHSYSGSDISTRDKRKGGSRYRVVRVPKTVIQERQASLQFLKNNSDYTHRKTIRIFVGSWNVNGQAPVPMDDWLNCDQDLPDIYAIGFQELDRSKEALLFHNSPREDEWLKAVARGLKPEAQYRKVALVRLVGMMLIVFMRKSLVPYVREIDVDTVGTGILGKLGNKGGVAVRFELFNTSVCFVNTHLAAHVDGNEKRNQNYREICSRISFRKVVPPRTIEDHDQVYWFGDLNYRITELSAPTIKTMIEKEQYDALLKWDQLRQNQIVGCAFEGYEEGRITFKPTYKYDVGTSNWDSSKKNRTPSWCDRIVWKAKEVKQLSYRSHLSLTISDHKPISALFDAQFHIIDHNKYEYIQREVTKQMDRWDLKLAHKVEVSPLEVIFGDVYFMERQTRNLTIVNNGEVSVQFEFRKKPVDLCYCKDWLHIETYAGSIQPGEKYDVELKIYVDKKTAHELNSGKDIIYDILTLYLKTGNGSTENGHNVNVIVNGSYQHSCFGSSLQVLSELSGTGINTISREKLINMEERSNLNSIVLYTVPTVITGLVEYLQDCGMKEKRLFEQPGLYSEILQIRDWLDSGAFGPILNFSVHSVAEALLLLLDSTPEPLIPYDLHASCLSVTDEEHNCKQCKQIISSLPPLNKNVFLYLCSFLRDLLLHADANELDSETTVTLFGQIFLRDPSSNISESSSKKVTDEEQAINQRLLDRKKSSFMRHIIVNLKDLV